MTVAQAIFPHLPYLRRFARSLTGRQESGDAYVATLLEALIADPASFPSDLPPRPALYRLFLSIWNSVTINGSSDGMKDSPLEFVHRRLEAISPRPRQAFLLIALEGFAPADTAEILGVNSADLQALLDEASREIAEQVATRVLIIEDEPLIALDLESLVTGVGHTVSAVARTRTEALREFRRVNPGLVLADIQLADGSSGLDAVRDILAEQETPVIFITAFPEQLLTGERPEPAFLIQKPFQPDMVKAVISQALFFDLKAKRPTAA